MYTEDLVIQLDEHVHNLGVCQTIDILKPTIHKETFVAGDKATLSFVPAVHEISHGTFYKASAL